MSFLAPFPGANAVVLTFQGGQGTGNTGAAANHTFSMDCGAGGDVVLCGQALTASAWSTVTIGGVTATIRAQTSTGSTTLIGIWTATGVPSGIQNVVLSVTGTSSRYGADLYLISGHSSLVPASTATDNTHTSGSPAQTLNVPSGGGVVGTGMEATGTATTASWSGITTDFSGTDGLGGTVYTSGSMSTAAANASFATSVTFSGGSVFRAIGAWAVWSP